MKKSYLKLNPIQIKIFTLHISQFINERKKNNSIIKLKIMYNKYVNIKYETNINHKFYFI
jgi:hypothetical protein